MGHTENTQDIENDKQFNYAFNIYDQKLSKETRKNLPISNVQEQNFLLRQKQKQEYLNQLSSQVKLSNY